MPRFINTIGRSTIAVAICQRCSFKMPHADMVRDSDTGMMMHRHCTDASDPWKLPPRAPDRIALRNARPDTPIDSLPPTPVPTTPTPDPNEPAPSPGDFGPDFSTDFS